MFRFLSGVVVGIFISERYNLPKIDTIATKIIKDIDSWSKKNP